MWRKTSLKEYEKLAQKLSKNLNQNSPQMPHFIESGKLAVGVCQACRSTVRPTGQRSYFRPFEPSVDRSVGRARIQRASLSVRSTGAFPKSRVLWTVDWVGRPATCQKLGVHVGRPPGRPANGHISDRLSHRSTGRSTELGYRE